MNVPLKMPDLATVNGTVKVLRWLVQPGEPIERGMPLLEVETDKATVVVESVLSGTLRECLAQAGADVATGDVIANVEAREASAPTVSGQEVERRETAVTADKPTPIVTPPRQGGSFFAKNRATKQEGNADRS